MHKLALCLALSLLIAGGLSAQSEQPHLAPHDTMDVTYAYDSGLLTNNTSETAWVDCHVLHIPGAPALRVMFDEVALGDGDWIEVYGHKDGYRHKLDAAELAKWQSSSGAFNGEKLSVYLFLAPGSSGSYVINEVNVGLPLLFNPLDTICGNDDRVVSNDPRCARFSSSPTSNGGCTIWMAGSDSCAISAGHCFSGGGLQWAEFNVPASLPSGSNQHPPIQDQYPLDLSTIQFLSGGVGNDYGACLIMANNLGQMPAANQGYYTLGNFMPSVGDPIRITGYGTDTGVDNQVQQTNVGPCTTTTTSSNLGYTTDTTGGNSGSPVIDETSGNAIGIHTHGGCSSTGGSGSNSGTSLTVPGFQTIYNQICNQAPAAPVATFNESATVIIVGTTVAFTDTSSGTPTSWAWDLNGDGNTDSTSQNPSYAYNTPGSFTVSLTVTNALGSDTITKPNHIIANAITPANLPFSEDFSGGMPTGGEWIFSSTGPTGQITTGGSSPVSPVSGSPSLMMDVSTSGTYVTNDAVLLINMAGQSGVVLTYWFMETADEPDPEDALFISDGTNEALAQDHSNAPAGWTQFTINVSNFASANGLSTAGVLRINFRQRDNFPIPTDGHLIDDIVIVGTGVSDVGQPNSANAALNIVGAVDQNGLVPTAGQNGPFFAALNAGGNLDMTTSGQGNRDFLLLAGALNRNNGVFPGLGSMDIGLLGGSGNYSDINVVMNGLSPTTFFDSMATTGNNGQQNMIIGIPSSMTPGVFTTFQVLMSVPGGFLFSAATELTIQ